MIVEAITQDFEKHNIARCWGGFAVLRYKGNFYEGIAKDHFKSEFHM